VPENDAAVSATRLATRMNNVGAHQIGSILLERTLLILRGPLLLWLLTRSPRQVEVAGLPVDG